MLNTTSRRTVLTSAAWAVPVVALAATAPAFASSANPIPACEIVGWRTNHGHDQQQSGTHHYHLTVGCASTVRAVWIAGIEATRHPSGVWTVEIVRGGVHQMVRVLTDDGVLPDREVRFQPTRPEGEPR